MGRSLALLVTAMALLLMVFFTGRAVEDQSRKRFDLEVMYLPSAQFMNEAALGYRNLAADILWFKTVQYYGGYRMGENNLALFNHLINVITELDPQFTFAYIFGALIIAEDLGYFEDGIRLIEKGIANNPTDWRLPFEMGFLYYVDARDYVQASRCFREASILPGANEIAGRFAAFVSAKAGHLETSIAMWNELARSSDNHYIRALADRYVEKLKKQLEKEKGE